MKYNSNEGSFDSISYLGYLIFLKIVKCVKLTVSPIVLVACPAPTALFNPAAAELAETPGRAGKSSCDIVNSLGSIAGCFTIPTICRIGVKSLVN